MLCKKVHIIFLFVVSCVFAGNVSWTLQDSLYNEALNAEEAGNFSLALQLFTAANDIQGKHNGELEEIIDTYKLALEEHSPYRFGFELSGQINHYNEKLKYDSFSEYFGNFYFRAYGFREFQINQSKLSLGGYLRGEYFIREENSVLDTSDYYLLPEFALQFEQGNFYGEGAFGVEWKEEKVLPTYTTNLENFFAQSGNHFWGGNFLFRGTGLDYLRGNLNFIWKYQKEESPYTHYVSFGATCVMDSVSQMIPVHFIMGDTIPPPPMPLEEEEISDNVDLFPMPTIEDIGMENLHAFQLERKMGILMGPHLFYYGQYFFSPWSISLNANLFTGHEVQLSAKRFRLDFDFALRFSYYLNKSTFYIVPRLFYSHYMKLDEVYKLIIPEDRFILNLELGYKMDF